MRVGHMLVSQIDLRSPVSTSATPSESRRIGRCWLQRRPYAGWNLRAAHCEGRAQGRRNLSNTAAQPGDARTSRTARFRRRRAQFSSSPAAAVTFGASQRVLAGVREATQPGPMAICDNGNAVVLPRKVAGHWTQPIAACHVIAGLVPHETSMTPRPELVEGVRPRTPSMIFRGIDMGSLRFATFN